MNPSSYCNKISVLQDSIQEITSKYYNEFWVKILLN